MSSIPSDDEIIIELAVAKGLKHKYGTNQPDKTYEQGVIDALMWMLGGPKPNLVTEKPVVEKGLRAEIRRLWRLS